MKTSSIWFHFTDCSTGKEVKAICHLCRKKLSYKTSIGNLVKHMQNVHPTVEMRKETRRPASLPSDRPRAPRSQKNNAAVIISDSEEKETEGAENAEMNSETPKSVPVKTSEATRIQTLKRKSNQMSMAGFVKKQMTLADKKTLDGKIFNIMTRDLQPFSVVEDRGFRELLEYLAPDYTIPSRRYFSNTYLDMAFKEQRDIALTKLRTADNVCITTDHWTSSYGKKTSYIGVTVHFIDEHFNFIHLTLECRKFDGEHTASNIADDLRNILTGWKILEKVLIIISDNASNIVAAVKNELLMKHFRCFAHKLNLCVQNSLILKELDKIIDEDDIDKLFEKYENGNAAIVMLKKIKKVVTHFNKSPQALQKLFEYQKSGGVKEPLTVINSVRTRWNSVYYMLKRYLKLKEAIKSTLGTLNNPNLPQLSEDEWALAAELVAMLKPFEEATVEMSGERYVTGSKIIPIANGLVKVTENFSAQKLIPAASAICKMLIRMLKKYFANIEFSNTLAVATFLDPRFKHKAFEVPVAVSSVQKEVVKLVTGIIKNSKTAANEGDKSSQEKKKKKEPSAYWAYFREKTKDTANQPVANASASAILEVQKYISEPDLDLQELPLLWWRNNAHHYPNLSKLVRSRCCLIATSVPCERIFSIAGIVLSARRSRLLPPKVNKLLFLHNYSSFESSLDFEDELCVDDPYDDEAFASELFADERTEEING